MPTREELQAQADALNARLGLKDPGNIESLLSGRASLEEYTRDNEARAGNYTGDRPFDSQSANYDQRTNQLSAAGRSALQASPMTLGRLVGLAGGDPRFNPAMPAPRVGAMPLPGTPTLGSLVLPPSQHVAAPDWSYLTRGR